MTICRQSQRRRLRNKIENGYYSRPSFYGFFHRKNKECKVLLEKERELARVMG